MAGLNCYLGLSLFDESPLPCSSTMPTSELMLNFVMFLVTFCVWVCWPSNSGEKGFTIWGPFFGGGKRVKGAHVSASLLDSQETWLYHLVFESGLLGIEIHHFCPFFNTWILQISVKMGRMLFSPGLPPRTYPFQSLLSCNDWGSSRIQGGASAMPKKKPKEIRPKIKGRDYVKPPWSHKKGIHFCLGGGVALGGCP